MFVQDDTVFSIETREEFIISFIRNDGRYVLQNTFDNTYIALTYAQLVYEFVLKL